MTQRHIFRQLQKLIRAYNQITFAISLAKLSFSKSLKRTKKHVKLYQNNEEFDAGPGYFI